MFRNFFKKRLEKKLIKMFSWKNLENTNLNIKRGKESLNIIRNKINLNLSKISRLNYVKIEIDEKFDELLDISVPIFSELNFWFLENKELLDNESQKNFQEFLILFHNYSQENLIKDKTENFNGICDILLNLYNEFSNLLD